MMLLILIKLFQVITLFKLSSTTLFILFFLFVEGIVQRTFCVNQDELISLMTDTPALSPYQSQVNATISVCLLFKQFLSIFYLFCGIGLWIYSL